MAEEEKLNDLAKERARQKAKKRLEQLNSGDLTRGLGGNAKSKTTISDVISTARKPRTTSSSKTGTTKSGTSKTGTKSTSSKASATKKTTSTGTKTTSSSTSKTKSSTSSSVKEKNKVLEKQLIDSEVVDVITANANRGKERRNKLIITILSISIVLVWTFILIMGLLRNTKVNHNVFTYISGDKADSCQVLLNDKPHSDWHIYEGLTVNTSYSDKISLKISETGGVNIRFRVEIYKDKTLLTKYGSIDTGYGFVLELDENRQEWYRLRNVVTPNTIILLTKISFYLDNNQTNGLTSDNIRINIFIEVN